MVTELFTPIFQGTRTPKDLPGLYTWLDFTDPSTLFTDATFSTNVTADADPIAAVRSKSSYNGSSVTQSTLGNRPYYKVNQVNGLSAAGWSGSGEGTVNDYMTFQTALLSPAMWGIAVVNITNTAAQKVLLGGTANDLVVKFDGSEIFIVGKEASSDWVTSTSAITAATWTVVMWLWDGCINGSSRDRITVEFGGVSKRVAGCTCTNISATTPNLGAGAGPGNYMDGLIAELATGYRPVSYSELKNVAQGYMSPKFNLPA